MVLSRLFLPLARRFSSRVQSLTSDAGIGAALIETTAPVTRAAGHRRPRSRYAIEPQRVSGGSPGMMRGMTAGPSSAWIASPVQSRGWHHQIALLAHLMRKG